MLSLYIRIEMYNIDFFCTRLFSLDAWREVFFFKMQNTYMCTIFNSNEICTDIWILFGLSIHSLVFWKATMYRITEEHDLSDVNFKGMESYRSGSRGPNAGEWGHFRVPKGRVGGRYYSKMVASGVSSKCLSIFMDKI
jgi:hypothetical protein